MGDDSSFNRLKQRWIDLDVKCLSLLTPAVVLVAWEAIDVTFSFTNRQLLSPNGRDFNYIIFVSMWQQLFAFVCLLPLVLARLTPASWEQLRRNLFGFTVLALLWILSALCTSGAQSFLGASIIEVVKCCMPFPCMLFSIIFERDRQGMPMMYPAGIVGGLGVLVAGACMAVFDDGQSSALGYFLAIIATCMVRRYPLPRALPRRLPWRGERGARAQQLAERLFVLHASQTACFYVAASVMIKTSSGGLNPINMTWSACCPTFRDSGSCFDALAH